MKSRILVALASLLLSTGVCLGQSTPNDSTQNSGFPRVVARLNLFNRTKVIGLQTLYTPPKSGLFRVSGTIVCTVANGSGNGWVTYLYWSNELGPQGPLTVASVPVMAQGTGVGYSGTFNATGGTPIQLYFFADGDTSGSQYNAYVILEQLE